MESVWKKKERKKWKEEWMNEWRQKDSTDKNPSFLLADREDSDQSARASLFPIIRYIFSRRGSNTYLWWKTDVFAKFEQWWSDTDCAFIHSDPFLPLLAIFASWARYADPDGLSRGRVGRSYIFGINLSEWYVFILMWSLNIIFMRNGLLEAYANSEYPHQPVHSNTMIRASVILWYVVWVATPMQYADNAGPDQPAHSRRLIRFLVAR